MAGGGIAGGIPSHKLVNTAIFGTPRVWEILMIPGVATIFGWILAFWAGALNTVSTLAVFFERTSHVSGRINDIGMNGVLQPEDALLVLLIWVGFCFGSYLAGLVLDRIGITRSLLVIAAGILFGGFLVWRGFYVQDGDYYTVPRYIIAFYLPVTMGFQNAVTTLLPIGRSTHWTGDSTDLGIAFAKKNYRYAIHNTLKIWGFICGAALVGYIMGMLEVPPMETLVLITVLYVITVMVLSLSNRIYVDRKKSAQSSGM
ncbi:MAG: DUF1275 family protein [Methanobacterium sp.]|jgi:uncharacterized membrane protein YoaK (UPF0700 family)